MLFFLTVNSGTIVIGSDDSPSTYSGGDDREDYVASDAGSETIDLNVCQEYMSHETFVEFVKVLEAKRLLKQNVTEEDRMQISDHEENEYIGVSDNIRSNEESGDAAVNENIELNTVPNNDEEIDMDLITAKNSNEHAAGSQQQQQQGVTTPVLSREPSDEGFPIDRWLQHQEEEDRRNAGTSGRLTAPPSETRRRRRSGSRQQPAPNENNLTDQLRAKQLQLVDEQIHLQQILQENARIQQEEHTERMELAKIQRRIAELELAAKQRELDQQRES